MAWLPGIKPRFTLAFTIIALGFVVLFIREFKKIYSYPPTAWTKDVFADCGIVLTGGPGRVRTGLDLLSQKAVRKLIISGVNPRAGFRDIFPQHPYYPGVDESDVILEKKSTTTYGNAHQSLSLVEAIGCRSIVVVTSKTHMHRALRTFEGTLPEGITLYDYAIVSGNYEPEIAEVIIETMKSVFYSLWAY